MTNEVLEQKLNSIARCLERLEKKKPSSLQSLTDDVDLQDILMINLERIVQTSVDAASIVILDKNLTPVPDTMAATFETLAQNKIIDQSLANKMKKAVGFRNIAVHEYDKINWEIVYHVVTKNIIDFKNFAKALENLK